MQPIIEVKNLKKQYRMGQFGGGTFTADFESFCAKLLKKEDPNIVVGQEKRLMGQTFMALNGIDLTVMPGEAVGIIGVNGAGKSTLLKNLCRITAPTEGKIILRGRIASMLEVGTGFHGEMTGRENTYLNGAILGMTKAEVDKKLEDIIDFSECRDFIDTPVKRYSSGMYVKLAFAVAAHLDSEIMIMDEVLAVGDTKFQKKCINKMKSVANDDGRTVLYVSHNMSTIRQLCSRCIVLKEGKVIYDGEVEKAIQIYSEESFDFGLKNIFDEANIIDKNSLVYIKSVEFLDEKDLFFNANEKIKIKVGYKSKIEKANMAVCCIIKYMGTSPVGTCVSNDFKVNETDEGYFTFELSLDGFIAGQYTCDLEIGEIETETFRAKGVQVRAFGFNIAKNKNYRYLDWNTNNWGLSVLPKLEVNAE